ncbi:uncharacterized protein VTP21DRAFT_3404 [Calcarisporiella thermophila]|uniref:uncharacterized protein n=1 Tax=Calcarisporiella thermophila TaxID=911321 RepID=UPI003743D085
MSSSSRRPWASWLPRAAIFTVLAASLTTVANGFYLPGMAPKDYKKGDKVELYVNALTPMSSARDQQLKSVISFDYYKKEFHFCPPHPIESQSGGLGSVLFGDRIQNSLFDIQMQKTEECKLLCTSDVIPKEDAKFINDQIREGYGINWIIDGLPAARPKRDDRTGEEFYSVGFELGELQGDRPILHNHYDITIQFHNKNKETYRVVGVLVTPRSLDIKMDATGKPICNTNTPVMLDENHDNKVTYTYSVKWQYSDTPWATRWDLYLHVYDQKIHWFSLVNSILIVLFLTGMVAMILLRALHKDIARYNSAEVQEDLQEDFGWKLVHGDVFRAPSHGMLLSVLLGNGAQLICMTAITLVFAILGFLSPSNRGSLATVMIIFFLLFGSVAGYVSARMYKMIGGEKWKLNIILTSVLFPGLIFTIMLILNFFLMGADSSGAVPFGTMLVIVGLWFLISLPLSFVGSYLGFKKARIEHPVRTNQIPRQIPDQIFYLKPIPSMLMGGVLPFGAIFIELYFIMNSIWFHRLYYVFGFLFLVFGVLILTCSEVTILMCYFHLCAEDYNWWWRAFLTSGASSIYVMLYSMLYYFSKLNIDSLTSTILYFGWSFTFVLIFFVLTGTIGFFACLIFVRKIYGSIKID